MWGHYSTRGQIGTVPVRAALAGPAWALHSIVGWVVYKPMGLLYSFLLHQVNASSLEKLIVRYHNSKILFFYKSLKWFLLSKQIKFNFCKIKKLKMQIKLKKNNQDLVKSKNSWINARIQKRTYLSSQKIYHLLEENAEEWSADGSESSDDGKEDHVSENALSDSSEEETINNPSVRLPNSFVSRNGSEIGLGIF